MTDPLDKCDPAFTTSVVIGASGGIGQALVEALRQQAHGGVVHALSRRPLPLGMRAVPTAPIDITSEPSVRTAAAAIGAPIDLLIVATGMLHDDEHGPERALRELDPDRLARSFAINTIGPALILKHFAPLLARDRRAVIALLSARVGSISDNRSGGWYGYRASKAALNMIIRSAAIELARNRRHCVCVGLHPGTVDTALSKPFQRGVPAGRLFSRERAAAQLLDVIATLTPSDSGKCFAWDRAEIAP